MKQCQEQISLFSAEASLDHANRSLAPESEKEQGMTVISGRKCSESLTSSDPLRLLAKMLLDSSAWRSRMVSLTWKAEQLTISRVKTTIKEYMHSAKECCSTVSCKTSVTSATPSSHLLFRLAVSKPRTSESGYLLLPTPTAMLVDHGGPNQRDSSGRPGLQMAARMWPTPRAKESGDYQYSRGNHNRKTLTLSGMIRMCKTPIVADSANRPFYCNSRGEPNLSAQVKLFPTPKARDFRSATGREQRDNPDLNVVAKMYPTPKATIRGDCPSERARKSPDLASVVKMCAMYPTPNACDCKGNHGGGQCSGLRTTTHDEAVQAGGQLNPTWVEWLMGLPLGWTDIDLPCETSEKVVGWWDIEPDVPRVEVGVKDRVNRLKCLGNAVVPYQIYPILQAITEIEGAVEGV